MKTKICFSALLLFVWALQLNAQNPFIGTWKLISVTGTEPDGKTFSINDSQREEMKIITPAHFIWLSRALGDSAKFEGAGAGTYVLNGNKYIETLTVASWEDYEATKTDFTVELKGDKFIQKGTITLANGQKGELKETWQKVELPAQNTDAIGTWDRITSIYTDEKGQQVSKNNSQEKHMFVLTPTHWMTITQDAKTKKVLSAAGGTYTKKGDKYLPKIELASWDNNTQDKFEVTIKVSGDKMVSNGINLTNNTKWADTLKRVNGKTNKVALTK